jgi:hypothetical protein
MINILEGNMFTCNEDRSELPIHDPHYTTYQCGSEYTNIAMYIWCCMVVVIVIGLLILMWRKQYGIDNPNNSELVNTSIQVFIPIYSNW